MNQIPSPLRYTRAVCFLSLCLLSFNPAGAQVTGIIKDSESNTALPYVNIQVLDKNSGASSDEQGKFILPDADSAATLMITATGYEPLQTVYRKGAVILLHKANVPLAEVTISSKRKGLTLKQGSYKKSDVRMHFAANDQPWILARYFPYDSAYKQTPFLKSVMIETQSDVKDAVFNLKLYRKDKDGLPGEFLYGANILGHAKKGKKNTVVDLSAYDIPFPEEGFFMGVEFMLVEQNRYTVTYSEEGKKGKYTGTRYAPQIGAVPAEHADEAFFFLRGKWEKNQRNTDPYVPKVYQGKYSLFAMELTLSD